MSRFAILLLLIFALGASFIFGFQVRDSVTTTPAQPVIITATSLVDGEYEVGRVIDGDTIELTNGTVIRYEGIDTPEQSSEKGKEATEKNKQLVEKKIVHIEVAKDSKDLYDRTLAYVFVKDQMVNKLLIEAGLAEPYYPAKQKKPKYWEELVAAKSTTQR